MLSHMCFSISNFIDNVYEFAGGNFIPVPVYKGMNGHEYMTVFLFILFFNFIL